MRQLKISSEKLTIRTDNISRYLTEVSGKKLLSPDEEYRIGLLAQQGDERAIEALVNANLRFVVSVAKQYSSTGALLEDLICQGNIGLCDAARLFDPSRGFKFISFAVWHIRKEILMYLNVNGRTVKLPQNVVNDLAKLRKIDNTILQTEGRYGTPEELQEAAVELGKNYSVEYIKTAVRSDVKPISLDADEQDDQYSPLNWLSSGSSPTHLTDEQDLAKTVNMVLSGLPEIERDVVARRMGIGYPEPETFSTIGERYGRTSEWTRLLYNKAIRRLKMRLRRDRVIKSETAAVL